MALPSRSVKRVAKRVSGAAAHASVSGTRAARRGVGTARRVAGPAAGASSGAGRASRAPARRVTAGSRKAAEAARIRRLDPPPAKLTSNQLRALPPSPSMRAAAKSRNRRQNMVMGGSALALGGLALQRNRSGASQGLPPRQPGSETGIYGGY